MSTCTCGMNWTNEYCPRHGRKDPSHEKKDLEIERLKDQIKDLKKKKITPRTLEG